MVTMATTLHGSKHIHMNTDKHTHTDPVLNAGCGWTCVGDELSSRRRSSFDDDQPGLLQTHSTTSNVTFAM